jgi:hypothetical protein
VPEIDPRQIWWEQARSALAEQNWPLLEGTLLRLLEAAPQQPEFLDLLPRCAGRGAPLRQHQLLDAP